MVFHGASRRALQSANCSNNLPTTRKFIFASWYLMIFHCYSDLLWPGTPTQNHSFTPKPRWTFQALWVSVWVCWSWRVHCLVWLALSKRIRSLSWVPIHVFLVSKATSLWLSGGVPNTFPCHGGRWGLHHFVVKFCWRFCHHFLNVTQSIPIQSMYDISTCIWLIFFN